jgi:hypothetical protein
VSSIEKIAMGIVGVAMVTTLILPDRQTPKVLSSVGSLFAGSIRASMGMSR